MSHASSQKCHLEKLGKAQDFVLLLKNILFQDIRISLLEHLKQICKMS